MKKTLMTIGLAAATVAAFGQGQVNFANNASTLFSTNGVGNSTGPIGTTATSGAAPGGYLFTVLTTASTVTSVDQSLQGLLSWADSGVLATNTATATGGRINAGSPVTIPANVWDAGVFKTYVVVGWSANEGSTWASVAAKLAGATLNGTPGVNAYWTGGSLVPGGFLGATMVTQGEAGGGSSGLPAYSLFGATSSGQGTPINTPTQLYGIGAVPEPTTFALAGMGAAAMLIFRRRK